MTKVTISTEFQSRAYLQFPFPGSQDFNQDSFLRRMERLNAKRDNARIDLNTPAPQYSDALLLRENEALETAWRCEVAAMIAAKRSNTAEATAILMAARAATEAVVERIEASRAVTPAGLEVKARAILWRRNGEPLEAKDFESRLSAGKQTGMEASDENWLLS